MSDHFYLAILFEENIEKNYINNVSDLISAHFVSKEINMTSKSKALLLKIKNSDTILIESESMLLYKNLQGVIDIKRDVKGFGNKFIGKFGGSKMDDMLNKISLNTLNSIDPRIMKYNSRELVSIKLVKNSDKPDDEKLILKNLLIDQYTSSEILKIHYFLLSRINLVDHRMIELLSKKRIIKCISGLHTPHSVKGSYEKVKDYFGEKIAIYIHFLRFYKRWMFFPLLLSLVICAIDYFTTNLYQKWWNSVIYSFLMIIWANFFVIFWNRNCWELSIEWNTYGKIFDLHDRNNKFSGVTQVSPISGLIEMKYSSNKRFFYYCCSAIEALPYLALALTIKILYLNALGFIDEESSFLFYSAIKSSIPKHFLSSIIIEIAHVVLISQLNKFYKIVNEISTQRENHKLKSKMRNSYIFKCFMFEFINRFLHLLYLAFIKQDLVSLSSKLLSFCIVDQLRRVGVESILPFFTQLLKREKKKKEKKNKTPPEAAASNPTQDIPLLKESENIDENSKIFEEKISELNLSDYNVDDDYLDIVFQFAILLLFCSVFKLSGVICFISNLIEFESDTFKLQSKLYRRGIPETANNIGVWLTLINFFIFLSVYTNTFLVIFYYEQIGKTHSESFYLVGYIIQQFMIFALIIFRLIIKDKPYWVRVFLKRKKFKIF